MVTQILKIFEKALRKYSNGSKITFHQTKTASLRTKKAKSYSYNVQKYFLDAKTVVTQAGNGGDGCISFLQLWCNERAGPDGGDGGNGGHVIFEASSNIKSLNHISKIICGESGKPGKPKECNGRNANHAIIRVPLGTIIRNECGIVVGDLNCEKIRFVAARGGYGGKGNKYFATSKENSPKVCEQGASGEHVRYILEIKSIADVGIIGFPNSGKSTLLNSITRTRSKVAPFAFTTLHPEIGMVPYADHIQLAVADLPGIIPGSHCSKGLGLQFLRHIERCSVLIYLLDASSENPWLHYEALTCEVFKYSKKLAAYPKIIVANKIDKAKAEQNLAEIKKRINDPVIGISAKDGTNLGELLEKMRLITSN